MATLAAVFTKIAHPCNGDFMYYHPLMLSTLHNDRMLSTWRVLTDVWFRAIERQCTVQANAVRDFCKRRASAV